MPYLWVPNPTNDPAWARVDVGPAGATGVVLTGDRTQAVAERADPPTHDADPEPRDGPPSLPLLKAFTVDGREMWAVFEGSQRRVRVNGLPLLAGMAVLDDRDELRVEGRPDRLYFTTERLATIETIGPDPDRRCPRCTHGFTEERNPVVRCPGCGMLHHQTDEFPCWTGYEDDPFPTCSMCDQPATLGGELRWSPEEL